ncbi:MAG: IS630 transposase-related protein [Treponema sp.]|nr:IS630 transposase-related protein [Treponema sp.]
MYSIEFIRCAVAYREEGHTFRELRNTFGIPPETYYQWKEKLGNGYDGTKVFRERKRIIDKEELKRAAEEKPDAYLYEFAQKFGCTPQAIFLMFKKLKITRKKRPLPIMKSRKRNGRNIEHG